MPDYGSYGPGPGYQPVHSGFTVYQAGKEKTPSGGGGVPWGKVGQVGAALLPLLGTALSMREAQKNREFQERMSSTSHQREVDDLLKAGLNPLLSGMRGASTPGGAEGEVGDLTRGITTAMQAAQFNAQTELLKGQASREFNSAALLATQNEEQRGTLGLAAGESRLRQELLGLDVRQRSALFNTAIAQAQASLDQTRSSAANLDARTALDELDRARAMNAEQLEQWLKGGSPAVRLFLDVLRGLRR